MSLSPLPTPTPLNKKTMKNLETLLLNLQPHAATLDGEQLGDLQALLDGLETSLAAAREEGRDLRIAVVGQMKAGKSSFLNAAFFGRDLLPKADIPMTAALTKIVYAPKAKAEVVFYTPDDWHSMEQRADDYARRYAEEETKLIEQSKTSPFARPRQPSKDEVDSRISESLKASAELVTKAKQLGLNVQAYLGKIQVLENIDSAQGLTEALHEYVGSGGRFTAITKMTVLSVDDPRLQGLEIIDTPGFNDPVVSRGQVTRNYLSQCDVIFLLSSLSQFMTAADMAVMREQLSEAGINEKAIFLIGSQRDIALRQDQNIARTAEKLAERVPAAQRAGAKVAAMMQLLDKKMGDYAHKTLDDQINQPGMDEKTQSILGAVRAQKPRFISAWAWLVAENFSSLSADDQDQLDKLCRDTGYSFDRESLRLLSNIPAVREGVLKQKEFKQQLIAGKEQALREGVRHSAQERLNQMRHNLHERKNRIRNGNIAELEKTEHDTVKRLAAGRTKLEDVFDQQVVRAQTDFALLIADMQAQSLKYLRVETVKETVSESYQVDTSWFGGLFGHDWETRYRNVVTVYASAQDAIERVEEFAHKTTKTLQKAIMECIDLEALRRNVGQAAMALFDTGSAEFDGEMMLAEVSKSLRRITIPDVNFGSKDYSQSIVRAFGSGRVSEGSIQGLKDAQRAAVASVIKDLEAEVNIRVKKINDSLETASKTFVTDMSRDIQASLTRLRTDIAHKEKSIENIDLAIKTLDSCLAGL